MKTEDTTNIMPIKNALNICLCTKSVDLYIISQPPCLTLRQGPKNLQDRAWINNHIQGLFLFQCILSKNHINMESPHKDKIYLISKSYQLPTSLHDLTTYLQTYLFLNLVSNEKTWKTLLNDKHKYTQIHLSILEHAPIHHCFSYLI